MKTQANHTVDKKTFEDFIALTKEKFINRSALIESFMKQWIQENKSKVDTEKK